MGTIWAKPVVDILVEIDSAGLEEADVILRNSGYICMNVENCRHDYNMGYTENGFAERVFHLHLRVYGDCDEHYFRDYLIGNPDTAREYERLKINLWHKYEYNRNAYTDAKGDFIRHVTDEAKRIFPGKYERKIK